MLSRREFSYFGFIGAAAGVLGGGFLLSKRGFADDSMGAPAGHFKITKTDAEWRAALSPQQYDILRQQGTEYPGTSPLLNEHRKGQFACVGCDVPAFSSDTKYDSGTGWPSFWAALPGATQVSDDTSLGMDRTEVHCATCGGHLGHVFDDGPKPTGKRWCMNGAVLKFIPATKA